LSDHNATWSAISECCPDMMNTSLEKILSPHILVSRTLRQTTHFNGLAYQHVATP